MKLQRLTIAELRIITKILKTYFPWLDTEDEASGAETVDTLSYLYNTAMRLQTESLL